ncbi:GD16803 [Drosophila simulans]|uniref:GD16803 n=1 Tax=Drosophila simulans TaxID=7240 RepID=B4R5M4_DROSI|nr:GD16803 [Drosophila simulans]
MEVECDLGDIQNEELLRKMFIGSLTDLCPRSQLNANGIAFKALFLPRRQFRELARSDPDHPWPEIHSIG